jgi:hypothetical protein
MSLAQDFRHTTYGIKYTHEGKTLEEKKKDINIRELKKSLSSRRLSKEEFQMLRKFNGNNR